MGHQGKKKERKRKRKRKKGKYKGGEAACVLKRARLIFRWELDYSPDVLSFLFYRLPTLPYIMRLQNESI